MGRGTGNRQAILCVPLIQSSWVVCYWVLRTIWAFPRMRTVLPQFAHLYGCWQICMSQPVLALMLEDKGDGSVSGGYMLESVQQKGVPLPKTASNSLFGLKCHSCLLHWSPLGPPRPRRLLLTILKLKPQPYPLQVALSQMDKLRSRQLSQSQQVLGPRTSYPVLLLFPLPQASPA